MQQASFSARHGDLGVAALAAAGVAESVPSVMVVSSHVYPARTA